MTQEQRLSFGQEEEEQQRQESSATDEQQPESFSLHSEESLGNTSTERDPLRDINEEEDDDDVTVIVLERGSNDMESNGASLWAEQDSPEMEARRRLVLLRELQRVQRASFVHFLILCLIPTSLLFIVIATVLGEDDLCESEATLCEQEKRTFINAFTTRCVCNAIPVASNEP